MAVKIQVEFFWVLTQCEDAAHSVTIQKNSNYLCDRRQLSVLTPRTCNAFDCIRKGLSSNLGLRSFNLRLFVICNRQMLEGHHKVGYDRFLLLHHHLSSSDST
jgi:hypothetical protein